MLTVVPRPLGLAGLIAAAALSSAALAQPQPLIAPGPWTPHDRAVALGVLHQAGALQGADDIGDAALSAALARYAAHELGQDIRPEAIDPMWGLSAPRRNVVAEMEAARAQGTLARWLASLPPSSRTYAALGEAERRYAAIVARGGWAGLPPGPAPKPGDHGPLVQALRARLAAEGYGPLDAAEPDVFDPPLQQALAAFQRRHMLADDGKLDAATRKALDVPAAERLAQIQANRERLRWLPRPLPGDRIDVDIAGARARLMEANQPTVTMKIVVGDPKHHTPMFTSRVDAVVFNPPWNVPSSIARAEILPKARRDRSYLARHDFVFVHGRLQQKPGGKCALGTLKFDLDSPFGVYLHDTPTKSAFDKRTRTLSHGCMRLEKPQALAERLLARQGWTPEMIAAAIDSKATRRVELKQSIPVFVVYRTAALDEAGQLEFRPDVYGWDAKLSAAMRGEGPQPAGAAAGQVGEAGP